MKLNNQQVYDIAKKAFNDLVKIKMLPCSWDGSYWNSGVFYIEAIDTKIFDQEIWHDAGEGEYILGRFLIPIKSYLWEDEATQIVDMSAKIPSNIEIATRIRLRIMYAIYCEYLNNIINCYRSAKRPGDPQVTLKNSVYWYKNL